MPRTGYGKAQDVGHDIGYYGMLAYGRYQDRSVIGNALSAGRMALRSGAATEGAAIAMM